MALEALKIFFFKSCDKIGKQNDWIIADLVICTLIFEYITFICKCNGGEFVSWMD